jgi:hypothetical protein
MPRLALIAALALALAGCGGGEEASAPGEPRTAPPVAEPAHEEQMTTFAVYVVQDGVITPEHRQVPHTAAVAGAAVEALLGDPPVALTIADGTADVTIPTGPRPSELAELVFTLTQFPTVERVRVNGGEPLTRDDFPDVTPAILVDQPAAGATVTSPLRVRGSASVFEATVQLRLETAGGEVLFADFTTATEGAPGRGTFAVDIPFTASGPVTLTVFELSAADGSEQNLFVVPLALSP